MEAGAQGEGPQAVAAAGPGMCRTSLSSLCVLTMAVLRTSSPSTMAARPSHETAATLTAGTQRTSAQCSMQDSIIAKQYGLLKSQAALQGDSGTS